ncbi:hypothetical protein BJ875DRAFT_490245 [Amylocarpus encephaloides]|uniref:Uncharacterized protein n=1 Tax=Amylocarpus encephaloides TaxID=45428 RepID=A0A9P7Y639_9HELO|nr:hypothetical protein BJ875DRAFT_490245 [Amylocarpus encephaloides]
MPPDGYPANPFNWNSTRGVAPEQLRDDPRSSGRDYTSPYNRSDTQSVVPLETREYFRRDSLSPQEYTVSICSRDATRSVQPRDHHGSISPEGYQASPYNRNGTQSVAPPQIQERFRTPQDETIAHEILWRNKDAKIDSRSRLSRAFTTKAKRAKFSDRDFCRALTAVVKGKEIAGPGVVEVLRDLFVEAGGDINFTPPRKSMGSIFKKPLQERSKLLETSTEAGNVDFVRIISRHSDKTSLNSSLDIALGNRKRATGVQRASQQDQILQILISKGADGSNTISAAVGVGDEKLLAMLLQGQLPESTLSAALPSAVTFSNIDTRFQLTRMLLEKGADVNHNAGESMLQATKLFDLDILSLLLEHRPRSESLSRAFSAALNLSDSGGRMEACHKLIYAGATGEEVNKGLDIAINTEHHNIDFMKLLLREASVDYENGHALCLAIANQHLLQLQLMLEKRPNIVTFDGAFAAAIRLRNPRDQLKYCRILVGAGPPRDSCSKALVVSAKSQKDELCKVFLEKGASPDFDGGASVTAAVLSENIGILEMLVQGDYQKPNNDSLAAGFEVALSMSPSRQKKIKILRLILDGGLQGPSLDMALVTETRKGRDGVALTKVFLEYGASLNFQGGEALIHCTCSGDLTLLEILLKSSQQPSTEILSQMFEASLKLGSKTRHHALEMILEVKMPNDGQVAAAVDTLVQEKTVDIQALQLLLSFGASVHYNNHNPLIGAARTFNKHLLSLLFAHATIESAASVVFSVLMKSENFWSKRETFDILTILLENGAEGTAVSDALIRTVRDGQPSARHFEVALLQYRVDVDHREGEALQIVTERGEPALVRRFLEMKPCNESISMAFPYAFHSKLGEENTLQVIETFIELAVDHLDPDFMHGQIPEPPVFLCINSYPNNLQILEATLRAGFRVNDPMSSEEGQITALYWALSSKGKKIADSMVELLISRSPDLRDHPEPLLYIAIESGRYQAVPLLVNAGADVDVANEEGVTPLSIASQKGDINSMRILLEASSCPTDGSLHDAAHWANLDAINLLLKYGYDANLPSLRFEGRPPLFELCFRAPVYLQQTQATAQQKEKKIKLAILALIEGGALTGERLPQAENRSILHHALDSANPYIMTKVFLECGQFKEINFEHNLFTNGEYTYSPTMYVKKGKCRGDKTQSQSLVTLLESFSATDRYWKNKGAQPRDMIDPPQHIQKAEDDRKALEKRRREEAEEERRRVEEEQRQIRAARLKLSLEAEATQAKLEKEERQFKLRQEHEQRMHQQGLARQNDLLRVQQNSDQLALRQATSLSRLNNDENEAEHRRRMILMSRQKELMQSWGPAYNQGLQNSGYPSNYPALGSSNKSNIDLRSRRRWVEGSGLNPRIMEID